MATSFPANLRDEASLKVTLESLLMHRRQWQLIQELVALAFRVQLVKKWPLIPVFIHVLDTTPACLCRTVSGAELLTRSVQDGQQVTLRHQPTLGSAGCRADTSFGGSQGLPHSIPATVTLTTPSLPVTQRRARRASGAACHKPHSGQGAEPRLTQVCPARKPDSRLLHHGSRTLP